MDKKMLAGMVAAIILMSSMNYVSADDDTTEVNMTANQEMRGEKGGNMGESRDKGESKGMSDEFIALLSDDELAQIEALSEDKEERGDKESMEDMSDEEKEEMKAEYQAAKEERTAQIKEILADNAEALAYLEEVAEAKEEAKETKTEEKADKKSERQAFREENGDSVDTYKKAFLTKLESNIDNISDEKIEAVLEKITAIEEKVEASTTMSDERKTTILSQVQALKEILEDALTDEV